MRIVVTLKRDAVAKVVLNNLYKHTQLQTTFGVNDAGHRRRASRERCGSTRSCHALRQPPDRGHRPAHPVPVAQGRGARPHPARPTSRPSTQLDAVIAADPELGVGGGGPHRADGSCSTSTRSRPSAILDLQLRRLAALERQRIHRRRLPRSKREINDYNDILARPERQLQHHPRGARRDRRASYGDPRRTRLVPLRRRHVSMEDLIAAGGRRRHDHAYRLRQADQDRSVPGPTPRWQGRARRERCKTDDLVAHFFVCSTHDWILFFTNKGRVYRTKTYDLPEANRNARGQHVANLLAFQPDETDCRSHHDQELRGGAVPGAGDQARA